MRLCLGDCVAKKVVRKLLETKASRQVAIRDRTGRGQRSAKEVEVFRLESGFIGEFSGRLATKSMCGSSSG